MQWSWDRHGEVSALVPLLSSAVRKEDFPAPSQIG